MKPTIHAFMPRDKGLFLRPENLYSSDHRMPTLDGLRAVSILIVLLSHFVSTIFPGGLGVYIFFVISGFLIAKLLFAEQRSTGQISLSDFYTRRIFRLYPVVLTFTAIVLAAYSIMGAQIDWIEPLSALFYFSNYLYANILAETPSKPVMPFLIFWSLSVEEHFYIAFPVLFALLKGRPAHVLLTMAMICAACLLARLSVAVLSPELLNTRYFYYRTEFRIDAIAYGVALAALSEMKSGERVIGSLRSPKTLLVATGAILLALVYRDPFFRETTRYTILGLGISLGLLSLLFSDKLEVIQRLLNSSFPIHVGRISYSLYVWHFIAPGLERAVFGLTGFQRIFALFLISYLLAVSSFHFIEKPFLSLRRRLWPKASLQTSPAVP